MARDYFTSIDLNSNQLIDARLENLASFPTAGKAGRLVWNTTALSLGADNGSAFRTFAFLDSPDFSGVPLADTAAPGTSTRQLATTAFVANAITGGAVADGDKGDITVSSSGSVWTVDAGAITLAKMASIATDRLLGNNTGSAAAPAVLTPTQVRTMLNVADGATANSSDATLLARANHTGTQLASTISDFASAVAATAAVTANTAKVSNATHTGDVTGATALTIANNAVTNAKAADMANATIKGRATAGTGDPEDLTATQVRTLINVANGATANSSDATLLSRANHTGTQLASTISDLSTAVTAIITSYVDTEAGAESALDTIAEMVVRLADLSDDIANVIQRHNQTFGDGTSTSYAITHNLASDDVTVEVYEVATKATVLCDVVRTSTNVVTLTVNPAPATNALRVVIKK